MDQLLQELAPSKTFLLVDSNTVNCLSVFVPKLANLDAAFEVLEVSPGEGGRDQFAVSDIEPPSGLVQ